MYDMCMEEDTFEPVERNYPIKRNTWVQTAK